MGKFARSARGTLVDFDLIAIKNQMASAPAPENLDARRDFIDAKDGVKFKKLDVASVTQDVSTVSALSTLFANVRPSLFSYFGPIFSWSQLDKKPSSNREQTK